MKLLAGVFRETAGGERRQVINYWQGDRYASVAALFICLNCSVGNDKGCGLWLELHLFSVSAEENRPVVTAPWAELQCRKFSSGLFCGVFPSASMFNKWSDKGFSLNITWANNGNNLNTTDIITYYSEYMTDTNNTIKTWVGYEKSEGSTGNESCLCIT